MDPLESEMQQCRRDKQPRRNTKHPNFFNENMNSHDFRIGVNTTLLFGQTLPVCSVSHPCYALKLVAPLLRKQNIQERDVLVPTSSCARASPSCCCILQFLQDDRPCARATQFDLRLDQLMRSSLAVLLCALLLQDDRAHTLQDDRIV